jgi:ABC-type xylose transport system permease subunit
MRNFHRKELFEKRTHSIYKPIFYLLIQIILIWEIFWILTGDLDISKWNYFEIIMGIIMIGFFAIKTVKIINRTTKSKSF